MLSIKSILRYILNELSTGSDRFSIIDWEHVLDTKTGVELHMYDDMFYATRDGREVIRSNAFTEEEQKIVWDIKELIAGPEKMKSRMQEYPQVITNQRKAFSELFEHPEPVVDISPIEESETEDYAG